MDDSRTRLAPLLVVFDAVAREGHLTHAAASLGMPQSTVSRMMRTLETTLDVALLQPAGRGIALTPTGQTLARYATDALDAIDALVLAVRDEADQHRGTVRFGFPYTLGSLPRLLSRFHDAEPGIRLEVEQTYGRQLSDGLRRGRFDLAIITPPPLGLSAHPLGAQEFVLLVDAQHRLAGERTVSLRALRDEDFVAPPTSYALRQLTDQWFREAGFAPRIVFESTEIATLRTVVEEGMGIAVLPSDPETAAGLREVALTGGDYRREIALASRGVLRAPVQLFADFLIREFPREETPPPSAHGV